MPPKTPFCRCGCPHGDHLPAANGPHGGPCCRCPDCDAYAPRVPNPGRKGRVPAYRLHKPSGQAVVTIHGKDRYLGRFGSPESKAEYGRLIAESATRPRAPVVSDLNVEELLAAYLEHVGSYYVKDGKPTSEQHVIASAVKPLRRLYANTPVTNFGPAALRTVRQAYIDAGHVRAQVNAGLNRVRRMFRWGLEHELVPPAVVTALQAVTPLRRGRSDARESQPVRAVPNEHIDAIQPHVSRQVWGMVDLQRLCGARPGEVCAMRAADIDMRGEVWVWKPREHKTQHAGRERVIALGPKAQAIVTGFLKLDPEAFLFSPRDAEAERLAAKHTARRTPANQGNTIGTNRRRRPRRKPHDHYTTSSYGRAVRRACDLAGIPAWRPNAIRHSFATAVRAKYGIEAARTALGHSDPGTTLIYAERDLAVAARVAQEVG